MLTGEQSALVFVEICASVMCWNAPTPRAGIIDSPKPLLPRFGVQFGSPIDRQRIAMVWPRPNRCVMRTRT